MRWVVVGAVLGIGCSSPQTGPKDDEGGAQATVFLATQDSFYLRLPAGKSSECVEISVAERLRADVRRGKRALRVSWRYRLIGIGFELFNITRIVFIGEQGEGVSRACHQRIAVQAVEVDGLRTNRGRIYDRLAPCQRDPKVFELGKCAL